jgi:hypothetical protein
MLYYVYQNILLRSNFLRLVGVDFPPRLSRDDLELTCRMIAESRHLYQKQMHNDNFYVVLRASQYPNRFGRQLIPCFERAGVRYIDYSTRAWPEEYVIKGEGHPSPAGHEAMADWLVKDLRLNQTEQH